MNENFVIKIDMVSGYDESPMLVIGAKTGVFYSAQVGGMLCLHPEFEGFVIKCPFDLGGLDSQDCPDLCSYGTEEKRKEWSKKIDSMLLEQTEGRYVQARFDFDRIQELTESWWPVVVWCDPVKDKWLCDISPFPKTKGIIYGGGNCD